MKPRTLLILTLLVAGLGAFWWFYERQLPGSDERAEKAKKVLPLEEKLVTAVTIEHGGKTIELTREPAAHVDEKAAGKDDPEPAVEPPAKWRLVQPLVAPADDAAVNGLLGSLVNLNKERTLDDPDRAGLGLDAPRAKVTLTTAAGSKTLEIGSEIPASSNMVVAISGETSAHVVGKYVFDQLAKPLDNWRGKDVFRASREDIERITLKPAGGSPVLLAKRGQELWVESPAADRADRDLVNALFSAVVGLRVDRFVEEGSAEVATGLAEPVGTLEVVLRGKTQPFVVEVGRAANELSLGDTGATPAPVDKRYFRVASESGTVLFTGTANLAEPLTRPASDWPSRSWANLEVYQVEKIMVTDNERPAESMTVVRDGGDWRRSVGEDKEGQKIAFTAVSDLLYAVTGARASSLQAANAADLGPPRLTLTLEGNDGKNDTLTTYAPRDAYVPVRAAARDVILLLEAATYAEFLAKLDLVRTAEPLPTVGSDEADGVGGGRPVGDLEEMAAGGDSGGGDSLGATEATDATAPAAPGAADALDEVGEGDGATDDATPAVDSGKPPPESAPDQPGSGRGASG